MNNISEQINNIINNLSEKLGVAAEKLYPVLIKQAYVDGVISLLGILLGLFFCIVPFLVLKIITKKDKNDNYLAEGWGEEWIMWWSGSILFMIVGLIFVCINIITAITAFANPDWYILQMILDKIQ